MQTCISHEPDVRPSLRLSHVCTVTKRKKVLPRYLYSMKERLSYCFSRRRMVSGGRPLVKDYYTVAWQTTESAGFLAEVGELVKCRVDAFAVVSKLKTKFALVITDAGICSQQTYNLQLLTEFWQWRDWHWYKSTLCPILNPRTV